MKALVFERNLPRFAAARVASALAGSGKGVRVGPLELVEVDALQMPGPDWVRVRPRLAGICGSDLATLDGRSSRYFEQLVSFPFVPGHEIVGDVEGGALDGRRVVVEPVLGCEARGIVPLCRLCRRAQGLLRADRLRASASWAPDRLLRATPAAAGRRAWSPTRASCTRFPTDLSDEAAVMVEPAACAVHAACAPTSPAASASWCSEPEPSGCA